MGRSKHSGPGALNIYGKESEQSKIRRGIKHKSDIGTEESPAGKLEKERKRKRKILDKIAEQSK